MPSRDPRPAILRGALLQLLNRWLDTCTGIALITVSVEPRVCVCR